MPTTRNCICPNTEPDASTMSTTPNSWGARRTAVPEWTREDMENHWDAAREAARKEAGEETQALRAQIAQVLAEKDALGLELPARIEHWIVGQFPKIRLTAAQKTSLERDFG